MQLGFSATSACLVCVHSGRRLASGSEGSWGVSPPWAERQEPPLQCSKGKSLEQQDKETAAVQMLVGGACPAVGRRVCAPGRPSRGPADPAPSSSSERSFPDSGVVPHVQRRAAAGGWADQRLHPAPRRPCCPLVHPMPLRPAGSKESLFSCALSASEEAMAELEEVVLYAFQQCVYYVSKVRCPASLGVLGAWREPHALPNLPSCPRGWQPCAQSSPPPQDTQGPGGPFAVPPVCVPGSPAPFKELVWSLPPPGRCPGDPGAHRVPKAPRPAPQAPPTAAVSPSGP